MAAENPVTLAQFTERVKAENATKGTIPAGIVCQEIINNFHKKNHFEPSAIRFIARILTFLYSLINDNHTTDSAYLAFLFTYVPVFTATNVITKTAAEFDGDEEECFGSYYTGLRAINEMAGDADAYAKYMANIDAVLSIIGVHYFFLKNKALASESGSVTRQILVEGINKIFINSRYFTGSMEKIRSAMRGSPTASTTMVFTLLKILLATDYTNTDATVEKYDMVLEDVYVPTLSMKN